MSPENDYCLPVWLYWEGERPEWIHACQKTVFAHAENVQLINSDDFDILRDYDRDINLANLCTAHRADFIRAFLLARFGGVWIDSDCVVMQSLSPIIDHLSKYDFVGYRERQGYVTNNFMGSRAEGTIAGLYYQRVCEILRSGAPIEWLTLGSHAITQSIKDSGVQWLELEVDLIQPVCWSNPEAFFMVGDSAAHEEMFNDRSYCYMLSSNMINGVVKANPAKNLLDNDTFFTFLLKKSSERDVQSKLLELEYRKNTDDDWWVIPEVITQDMYRVRDVLSTLAPACPSYIIDCGAHIGAFSVMCSLHIKNIEVISFEPNPDSFNYLSRNAAKFGKVTALNKAVDIKNGTLKLYVPDQIEWSGRWSVTPNSNEYVTVESIALFSFIKNLDKPVFMLKLDLEGYEELIIDHATQDDLALIKTIVLETHSTNFNHEKLKEAGFELLFQPNISSDRQYVYSKR